MLYPKHTLKRIFSSFFFRFLSVSSCLYCRLLINYFYFSRTNGTVIWSNSNQCHLDIRRIEGRKSSYRTTGKLCGNNHGEEKTGECMTFLSLTFFLYFFFLAAEGEQEKKLKHFFTET